MRSHRQPEPEQMTAGEVTGAGLVPTSSASPLQLSSTPLRVQRGTVTRTLGREGEEQLRWKAQIRLFICCKVKIKCFLLFHTSLVGRVEGLLTPSPPFCAEDGAVEK